MLPTTANNNQSNPDSQKQYNDFLTAFNHGQLRDHFDPDRPPILAGGQITFFLKPGTPPQVIGHMQGRYADKVLAAIRAVWGNSGAGAVRYEVAKHEKPQQEPGRIEPGIKVVDRRKPKHFRVDNELYDNGHAARMKPSGLSVYLCLCRHADYYENNCYPSYTTIAKKCGLSRQSVITHVKRLADLGYLEIEHNFKNGEFATNTFYILELPIIS